MAVATLVEKVLRNFSKIRLRKAAVKAPRVKARKARALKPKKDDGIPIPSIVSILIKAAVEKAKKEEAQAEDNKDYTVLKDDKPFVINGGYGSASSGYSQPSHSSYVDYDRLFSYLGKFRAKSAYENKDSSASAKLTEDSNKFSLIDLETIEKGAKYTKYFAAGFNLNPLSLVPISGMNSADWEQFKLWMKLDPVMYRLKTSTS